MASLKTKNLPYLGAVLAADALAAGFVLQFSGSGPFIEQASRYATTGVAAVVAGLILSWLLPAQFKATLVYWRITHVLPGHRAFSELAPADERIDMRVLRQRLGKLPIDPKKQNRLWYPMLKKHEKNDEGVAENHQRSLFFRDASATSVVLAVVALAAAAMASDLGLVFLATALAVQYLVLMVAGRTSGERLVQNVLARECADNDVP
jgi:hypothetical protein